MLRSHKILTIRKVFMLICLSLVVLPPALFVAWLQDASGKSHGVALTVVSFGLLLATLAALRLGLVFVAPIRAMIAAAERMRAGDAEARAPAFGPYVPSEIRALQQAFNAMADANAEARRSECEARRAAESESRAKSDFLRFVTHELRSPTTAIIGFGEMLATERLGPLGHPSYREHVRDILSGSRHLLSLINDLLDLSKIEAGQYVLTPEPIGADELMERCSRYLKPVMQERRISISISYLGSVPTLRVDERAMFQVLLNLATNAVRYGYDGGHLKLTAQLLPDGSAELAVEDDGPGIDEADLARVMEPFQRVDNAATRHVQGTGLGLPIVKRLVELHDGRFQLSSVLGKGTRAVVLLPPQRVEPECTATLDVEATPDSAQAKAARLSVAA